MTKRESFGKANMNEASNFASRISLNKSGSGIDSWETARQSESSLDCFLSK